MRTVQTCLLILISLMFCTVQAVVAPQLQVDRAGPVVLTNGTTDFPFIPIPIVSPTVLTYNLRNTGNMPLSIHTPVLSGVVGGTVAISTQPASVVAAGASTTVAFTITGAPGNVSFKVSIGNTDLDNNPFTWTVKTGTPESDISVIYDQVEVLDGFYKSTNPLEVGQADLSPPGALVSLYTFVVRNVGIAPLTISNITTTNLQCTATRLSPLSFPQTIIPGGQLSVIFDILPNGTLTWTSDIHIINDDGSLTSPERDFSIVMSGGFESNNAPFTAPDDNGEVRVSSPTSPFTIIKNNGVAKTTPQTSFAGVATDYAVSIWNMNRNGATLRLYYPLVTVSPLVFGPCVTVVPKGPVSSGPINSTAVIQVQPPSVPATIPPILNDGTIGWTEVAPWPPPPFAPFITTVTVRVTPTRAGAWSVPLTFKCNDMDGEAIYNFTLSGNAIGDPDMSVTNRGTTLAASGTIATGITSAVGFTNTHSFVVTNTGTGTLLLPDTVITGSLANCTVVGVPTASATALAPGGKATLTVRTTPTALGPWSASFNITSNDPVPSPFVVTVSGTATPPVPEMDIFNVSTAVPVGGTATAKTSIFPGTTAYSITMQNSGTGLLTVASATVGALTNCTATITSPATFPATIAALDPSTSIPLVINVTPIAEGPWTVALTVNSDDADEGAYTFTLSGTATKIKKQDQCGIGSGFSLLLLMLIGAVLPFVLRRR